MQKILTKHLQHILYLDILSVHFFPAMIYRFTLTCNFGSVLFDALYFKYVEKYK